MHSQKFPLVEARYLYISGSKNSIWKSFSISASCILTRSSLLFDGQWTPREQWWIIMCVFFEQVSFFKFAKFQMEYLSLSVFVGSASRRCMLDNNGVAFWGPPSFARCVSLEYRYLHLSVSSLLTDVHRTLKLFQHENKSVYSSIFHHLSLSVAVLPAIMTPLHQTCLTT